MATKVSTFKPTAMDKIVSTSDGLDKAFKSIKSRGAKLQHDVHNAAVGVLLLMLKPDKNGQPNNDVRIVNKLFDHLPASYRTNALRDWFVGFGNVAFDKGKAVYADKGRTISDAIDGNKMPFWEFTEEPVYVPVDVTKMLDALIKKLRTDEDKAEGVHHTALIKSLEALKPTKAEAYQG